MEEPGWRLNSERQPGPGSNNPGAAHPGELATETVIFAIDADNQRLPGKFDLVADLLQDTSFMALALETEKAAGPVTQDITR